MFSSIRIAAIMSIGMFFVVPVALAQGTNPTGPAPTQADFDVCNKQAEAQAGSPSAAAKPRTGPMITGPVTPETGAQGGPAPSSPSASTPSTTTPGAAGEKPQNAGGAQVVRPDAEGAQTTGSANAGNPTKDVRITGSDTPGAREAGLSGMSPAAQNDAAYQQAYRDCMKSRGF